MATINIDVSTGEVERAIQQLIDRSSNLRPPFMSIGESMINSTRQRFRDEEAPDGSTWAPLSPVTTARKGHDRILESESRQLARQLSYTATGDSLEWGSSMVYAAMQHFGGRQSQHPHLWGDIPARPFLGLSDDDEEDIVETLRDWLEGAI